MDILKKEHIYVCFGLSVVCLFVGISFEVLQATSKFTSFFLNPYTYYVLVLALLLAFFKIKCGSAFLVKSNEKLILMLLLAVGVLFAGGFVDTGIKAITYAMEINTSVNETIKYKFIKLSVQSVFLMLCSFVLYVIASVIYSKVCDKKFCFVACIPTLEILIIFSLLAASVHIFVSCFVEDSVTVKNLINRVALIFTTLILLSCKRSSVENLSIVKSCDSNDAPGQRGPLFVVMVCSVIALICFFIFNPESGPDGWRSFKATIDTIAKDYTDSGGGLSYNQSTALLEESNYVTIAITSLIKSYLPYLGFFVALCLIVWGLFNSIMEIKVNLNMKLNALVLIFSFFIYGASIGFTKLVSMYVAFFSEIPSETISISGFVFAIICLIFFEMVIYHILISSNQKNTLSLQRSPWQPSF